MPITPLACAAILLTGGSTQARHLIATVLPAALDASRNDMDEIRMTIQVNSDEVNVWMLIPPFRGMEEFRRLSENGEIFYDTVTLFIGGQAQDDLERFTVQPSADQLYLIRFIGRYKEEPYVEISADNRSNELKINFG